MRRAQIPLLALVLAVAVGLACAHPVQRRDWSDYQGPGAEFFQQEEARFPDFPDPVEPFNRSAGVFNHGFMVGLVAPLGWVYRHIIPRFARKRIQQAAVNLVYPRRLLTNLLQGRFRAAGDETLRFLTNTTIGIGGLFDPASRWGIPLTDEDFGQTFATWGWRRSTFINLPVAGPSTIRDGIGLIPDTLSDPATYFFPAGPALQFNELSDFVVFYKRFTSTTFDPYRLSRLFWMINRERVSVELSDQWEDTGAVQTLEAVFFAPTEADFARRVGTRSVEIPTTGKKLPYTIRMQDEPAPIVYVLPGLGAHRAGDSPLALAEMAWSRGFSIVVVSSSMNFEFMDRASSVPVPGHAPVDSRDVHVALQAIHEDVEAHYPGKVTSHALMGYSLGAFHTMYIAAAESDPGNELIAFDRYVALDTPVRLVEGMKRLDEFFNVPLQLPPEERDAAVLAVLHKAIGLAQEDPGARDAAAYSRAEVGDLGDASFQPTRELPFTDLQAQFLIGLAFRLTLSDIIFQSQEKFDLGVLKTERGWFRRHSAYVEISEYSFAEYLFAFVLPYFCEHRKLVCDADDMIAQNDLHSIADGLAANGKLRQFANKNDFLTTPDDRDWLTGLLGPERSYFFPRGGHLGNLHKPVIQERVMSALTDLLPMADVADARP